jgi:hypothetical protein
MTGTWLYFWSDSQARPAQAIDLCIRFFPGLKKCSGIFDPSGSAPSVGGQGHVHTRISGSVVLGLGHVFMIIDRVLSIIIEDLVVIFFVIEVLSIMLYKPPY